MKDNISIRTASYSDAQVITQLGITTFTETFAADNKKEDMDKYLREEMNEQRISAELADSGNLFFLAEYDNMPAGFAKMRATKQPVGLEGCRAVEIERIYVLRSYQDKKIGAALMQHCIDHAVTQGYDALWLGVWEHNLKAVNFYKRWGFESGSHIFRLGDDEQTDMLMKKML